MFLHSPKDKCKSVHIGTIHNSPKLKINQMAIIIQMNRNNCSMNYDTAMTMNKVLPYGTMWINLEIITLGERSHV